MRSILLIDDEIMVARSMAILLQRNGYEVAIASSKQEAIETFKKLKCDLVLLDLMLSGSDGLELLPVITSQKADAKVIILTGQVDQESARRALQYGVRDYVIKPVEPERLIERVRLVLEDANRAGIDQEFTQLLDDFENEEKAGGNEQA